MNNKVILIIAGVIVLIAVLLLVFKDKLFPSGQQQKTATDQTGATDSTDTSGTSGGWTPITTGTAGSGGGSVTTNRIQSISARFQTGKPLYQPTTWRNITTEVTDYVNRNDGVINIGTGKSWIKQFNLPLTWGIFNGIVTMQSPSAKIEFTYTTTNQPNTPLVRTFTASQKLLVP